MDTVLVYTSDRDGGMIHNGERGEVIKPALLVRAP